ncbi:MAG: Y-family DNA polymerase [Ferruginibacter sp.]
MFALVDCNNFYPSCERLFRPELRNRPLVVLSNNDGCVIARSDEAKMLGIVMGTPAYMNNAHFKKNKVVVFSSNYTLYGDMSDRVMKTLSSFVPRLEIYSIDEAFLDMGDMVYADLGDLGLRIRHSVMQDIGIPVTVGIAATKTLAKMANRHAKKAHRSAGVFYAANAHLLDEMLRATKVEDIWGIGKQYGTLLRSKGFDTAFDVLKVPEEWMRTNLTVVGQRLWNELKGIPAIESEYEQPGKKNICTSRSFGKLTADRTIIEEALANHAAGCAEKLRRQQSVCSSIHVFLKTNVHRVEHRQYMPSITLQCENATNYTGEIIAYALKALDIIYRQGFLFMKCGVIVSGLAADNVLQKNLFDHKDRSQGKKALAALDKINKSMGEGTVRMAVQRFEKRYALRADHLSNRYTTHIDEILNVQL